MGSMLFSAPIIASLVPDCHQILRKSCQESVRKGLKSVLTLGTPVAGLMAGENGHALFDECPRCFPVVLGAAGLHLVNGFHIKQLC